MTTMCTRRGLLLGGATAAAFGLGCNRWIFREPLSASDRKAQRRVLLATTGSALVSVTDRIPELLSGPTSTVDVASSKHPELQRTLAAEGLDPPQRVHASILHGLSAMAWDVVTADPVPPGAIQRGALDGVTLTPDMRLAATDLRADSVFLVDVAATTVVRGGGVLVSPWITEVQASVRAHLFDATGRKMFRDVVSNRHRTSSDDKNIRGRLEESLEEATRDLLASLRET